MTSATKVSQFKCVIVTVKHASYLYIYDHDILHLGSIDVNLLAY